jgi:predicted nucleic acid-binding protein
LIIVDTDVLLDIVLNDPKWSTWSITALEAANARDKLGINPVIYAEVSIAFARIEQLEQVLAEAELTVEPIPREALFLAGKVFLRYRKPQGSKTNVLPDFFVGAHAAVAGFPVLTRDVGRYRSYFPTVHLLTPICRGS